MSGHLVCKSGFGLGKVAKLMLASVVVLSSLSGGVSAGCFGKKSNLSIDLTKTDSKKKTKLSDVSVKLCDIEKAMNGVEVDMELLNKRITVLLRHLTSCGPESPDFGASENIVKVLNKKGETEIPKRLAQLLCKMETGKTMRCEWAEFREWFIDILGHMVVDDSVPSQPTDKEGSQNWQKEYGHTYYKNYVNLASYMRKSLKNKLNFDERIKQMETDTTPSTAETPSKEASAEE
uniref:Membrane protein n=1 Tax=Babesia bovis TaxID=5865 RepID=S6BG66_BABBO|nr:membrane protein [Babesia bovis]